MHRFSARLSGRKIAVLEADPLERDGMVALLAFAGGRTVLFEREHDLEQSPDLQSYDAILLDYGPGGDKCRDGFLRRLRLSGFRGGCMFLVGQSRGQHLTYVLAEEANDYLIKPARPGELVSRVEALCRHSTHPRHVARLNEPPYEFSVTERKVFLLKRELRLTAREFDLALFMFKRIGQIVRREHLLQEIWKINSAVETRTVDVHMSRLRQAIKLSPENGFKLSAVHGHGYRLDRSKQSPSDCVCQPIVDGVSV